MARITAASFRIYRVFRVLCYSGILDEFGMTLRTGGVGSLISGYLSFDIAFVHRMATEAINAASGLSILEARGIQNSLILVGRQARRTIRPKTISE
jgi:hypothetical protein